MAVPKRKVSPSRAGKRRSSHSTPTSSFSECGRCGELKFPHTVCSSCGFYRDMRLLPARP